MPHWFTRLKPGASPRTHLFLTSILWTAIGFFLLYRGVLYLQTDGVLVLVIPGIILGSLKSRYILDKSAFKGVERIKRFGDNTCIGAVYSWKTWLLVAAMMVFGFIIRTIPISASVTGTICIAIGWAVIYSSRYGWRQWLNWGK